MVTHDVLLAAVARRRVLVAVPVLGHRKELRARVRPGQSVVRCYGVCAPVHAISSHRAPNIPPAPV
jgi:hypothetical protein